MRIHSPGSDSTVVLPMACRGGQVAASRSSDHFFVARQPPAAPAPARQQGCFVATMGACVGRSSSGNPTARSAGRSCATVAPRGKARRRSFLVKQELERRGWSTSPLPRPSTPACVSRLGVRYRSLDEPVAASCRSAHGSSPVVSRGLYPKILFPLTCRSWPHWCPNGEDRLGALLRNHHWSWPKPCWAL